MDEAETAGVPLDLHEEHFKMQQFDSSLQRKQRLILIIDLPTCLPLSQHMIKSVAGVECKPLK